MCPDEPPKRHINPERVASRVASHDPAGRNGGARQLASRAKKRRVMHDCG
jgi:hypothetical protein